MQELITAAGGDDPAYIRPPYGNANQTVRSNVSVPLINWAVDPLDWKYRNADTVCNNIVSGAYDGAIILAHDIHKTSVPGALAAIDELLDEGYEFVTVKDLFKRRGVTPRPGRSITTRRTTASTSVPSRSAPNITTRTSWPRTGAMTRCASAWSAAG